MDKKNIVTLNNIEKMGKKKADDSSQQQKIEKPAPSQGSSQQQKIEKPAPSQGSSQQQKIEKPAPPSPPPSAAATGTTSGADPRNPYNDPTLPNYNPDLGKKKEDGTSQQKIEKPAPSSDSGTIPSADPRNPYNDPTLPNYNPD